MEIYYSVCGSKIWVCSPSGSAPDNKKDDLLDLYSVRPHDVGSQRDEMAPIRAAIIEALPQLSSGSFPHLLAEALKTLVWLVPFESPVQLNSSSARGWATGFPSAGMNTLSE